MAPRNSFRTYQYVAGITTKYEVPHRIPKKGTPSSAHPTQQRSTAVHRLAALLLCRAVRSPLLPVKIGTRYVRVNMYARTYIHAASGVVVLG